MAVRTTHWASLFTCLLSACAPAAPTSHAGNGQAVGAFPTLTAGSAAPVSTGPTAGSPVFDTSGNAVLPPPAALTGMDGSCNQDVDVVFSLDVSGSMTPSLTKLADEVGSVDVALATKNLPSKPHYGLVIFVDDVMVMNNGQAYANVDALKAEITNQAMMTSMSVGRQVSGPPINTTWPENSLDSLYAAASMFQWRPSKTTLRIIFHITDASFWDGTVASSGAASEMQMGGNPVMSMHSYTDTIAMLRMQQIWVNTFAAKTGGPPDGMMAPASHGNFRGISVDVGIGFFEPYMGQKSIADSTGGTAWDLDDVYDGKLTLGAPIEMSIEARQCVQYPG